MKKKFGVVIVDDEPLAIKKIENLLIKSHFKHFEILGTFTDSIDALEYLNREMVDLLFLDIQMPELNGFELIRKLRKPWPQIIFTTAHNEYAVDAFRVHALDYLLKPIDEDHFNEAINKVLDVTKPSQDSQLELLMDTLSSIGINKNYRSKIPIKRSDKIYFINDDDILWVQASGKYVEVKNGDNLNTLKMLISDFEATLNPEKFLRIHRSVIININHVKQIHYWFRGEYQVLMSDGKKFTTGKKYRENLNSFIN